MEYKLELRTGADYLVQYPWKIIIETAYGNTKIAATRTDDMEILLTSPDVNLMT